MVPVIFAGRVTGVAFTGTLLGSFSVVSVCFNSAMGRRILFCSEAFSATVLLSRIRVVEPSRRAIWRVLPERSKFSAETTSGWLSNCCKSFSLGIDHTFTVRSAEVEATRLPSALMARAVISSSWAKRTRVNGLICGLVLLIHCHNRICLSAPAAITYWLSGVKAVTNCSPVGWPNVSRRWPVFVSHNLTAESPPALASTVPSGLKAMSCTGPLWPLRVRMRFPEVTSHNWINRS